MIQVQMERFHAYTVETLTIYLHTDDVKLLYSSITLLVSMDGLTFRPIRHYPLGSASIHQLIKWK